LRLRMFQANDIASALQGSPATMVLDSQPRFQAGDRVRARNNHPTGHTREPRYVRGRIGVVCQHHGGHIFPDQNAIGIKEARHLYSVRFEARELWGDAADLKSTVHVDLWEGYLEPA